MRDALWMFRVLTQEKLREFLGVPRRKKAGRAFYYNLFTRTTSTSSVTKAKRILASITHALNVNAEN
jgi:hypothetical protein